MRKERDESINICKTDVIEAYKELCNYLDSFRENIVSLSENPEDDWKATRIRLKYEISRYIEYLSETRDATLK